MHIVLAHTVRTNENTQNATTQQKLKAISVQSWVEMYENGRFISMDLCRVYCVLAWLLIVINKHMACIFNFLLSRWSHSLSLSLVSPFFCHSSPSISIFERDKTWFRTASLSSSCVNFCTFASVASTKMNEYKNKIIRFNGLHVCVWLFFRLPLPSLSFFLSLSLLLDRWFCYCSLLFENFSLFRNEMNTFAKHTPYNSTRIKACPHMCVLCRCFYENVYVVFSQTMVLFLHQHCEWFLFYLGGLVPAYSINVNFDVAL